MIDYVPGSGPEPARASREIEFVGGPRAGRRAVRSRRPATIRVRGHRGAYRRSVACADDALLRYVWSPTAP